MLLSNPTSPPQYRVVERLNRFSGEPEWCVERQYQSTSFALGVTHLVWSPVAVFNDKQKAMRVYYDIIENPGGKVIVSNS